MKKITKRSRANFLVFCVLTIFFSFSTFSQGTISGVIENNLESRNVKTITTSPYNLLHGNNPTIYIKNSKISNITGDDSLKVLILFDGSSSLLIQDTNSLLSTVEVITIALKQWFVFNYKLDLSSINQLTSLKYVYVNYLFDDTNQHIVNYVPSEESVTTLFYEVLKEA